MVALENYALNIGRNPSAMGVIPNIPWLMWKMWMPPSNWLEKSLWGHDFFFPWGGTCVVSLKSFSSRRCWKFREKAGATGFLETYFMVQNQGTAFIWDTFLQETWDAVRWFCYFSPYNVNGPKLIRNQKLTCHWKVNRKYLSVSLLFQILWLWEILLPPIKGSSVC